MDFVIKLLVFIVCVSGLAITTEGVKNDNRALESCGVFIEMLGLSLVIVYSI